MTPPNYIELRYRHSTRKILGHTQVILNQKPIGFFLPCQGLGKDENYHLTLDNLEGDFVAEYFRNRNEVIKFLGQKFGTKQHPLLLADTVNQRRDRCKKI